MYPKPHAGPGVAGGKRPRWPLVVVVALEIIQSVSLAPWLVMVGLSVMAFDAPGSERLWGPWAFVLAVWSYPLWLIAAGVASWILIARGHRFAALAIAAALTIPSLLAVIILAG